MTEQIAGHEISGHENARHSRQRAPRQLMMLAHAGVVTPFVVL